MSGLNEKESSVLRRGAEGWHREVEGGEAGVVDGLTNQPAQVHSCRRPEKRGPAFVNPESLR